MLIKMHLSWVNACGIQGPSGEGKKRKAGGQAEASGCHGAAWVSRWSGRRCWGKRPPLQHPGDAPCQLSPQGHRESTAGREGVLHGPSNQPGLRAGKSPWANLAADLSYRHPSWNWFVLKVQKLSPRVWLSFASLHSCLCMCSPGASALNSTIFPPALKKQPSFFSLLRAVEISATLLW